MTERVRGNDGSPHALLIRFSFLGIGFYWAWIYSLFFRTSLAANLGSPSADLQIKTVLSLLGALAVFAVFFFAFRVIKPKRLGPILFASGFIASLGTLLTTATLDNFVIFISGSLATGFGTGFLLVYWGKLYGSIDAKRASVRIALSLLIAIVTCLVTANLETIATTAVVSALPLLSALLLYCANTTAARHAEGAEPCFAHFPFKLMVGLFACGLSFGFIMNLVLLTSGTVTYAMSAILVADAIVTLIIAVMTVAARQGINFRNAYWVILPLMGLGFLLLPLFSSTERLIAFFFARLGYSLFDVLIWIRLSSVSSESGSDTTHIFCGFRLGLDGGVILGNILGIMLYDFAFQHLSIISAVLVFLLIVILTITFNQKDIETSWGLLKGSQDVLPRWKRACQNIADRHQLTKRETEIMILTAQGRSVSYIAECLVISTSTVQSHSKNLYRKLDIHSRQELITLIEDQRQTL